MFKHHLNPAQLHHAYVITGANQDAIRKTIEEFLEKEMKLVPRGNPDIYMREYVNFGIDDVADVLSAHIRRPMGEKKIIVALANSITMQAQNSLLKMIEEPTAHTHFFIGVPSASILLPTVLSRVHVIALNTDEDSSTGKSKIAKEFISSTAAGRLDMIKGWLADLDREKTTKEDIFHIVADIEYIAHEEALKKTSTHALSVLARVDDYLRDPSSSLKMLLEYLALELPIF